MKYCPRCKETKDVSQFFRDKTNKVGCSSYCKECKHKVRPNYHARYREAAISLLGSICVKCSFDDKRALQIDHVAGNGNEERKKLHPTVILKRVLTNPEDYQLLCANCNAIKAVENKEFFRPRFFHPKKNEASNIIQ